MGSLTELLKNKDAIKHLENDKYMNIKKELRYLGFSEVSATDDEEEGSYYVVHITDTMRGENANISIQLHFETMIIVSTIKYMEQNRITTSNFRLKIPKYVVDGDDPDIFVEWLDVVTEGYCGYLTGRLKHIIPITG